MSAVLLIVYNDPIFVLFFIWINDNRRSIKIEKNIYRYRKQVHSMSFHEIQAKFPLGKWTRNVQDGHSDFFFIVRFMYRDIRGVILVIAHFRYQCSIL